MSAQPGLFDAESYYAEPKTKKPRVSVPEDGVLWKRTALRRECDECMREQHANYDPNGPLPATRRRANVQMFVKDDRGDVAKTWFLCTEHGEAAGWDSSRSKDTKRRRQTTVAPPPVPEPTQAQKLTSGLRVLAMQAKTGWIGNTFGREAERLITKAGGRGLDMPEWQSNPHADGLIGMFRTQVTRCIREWAECFGTDIDTDTTVGETCMRTVVRLGDGNGISVTVYGYTNTP